MEYEILSCSRMLDRIDYLSAEFHEARPGSRDVSYTGDGGDARALAEHCASFFPPERMRIVFCPKWD